jgi:hypothetical protein
MTEPEDRFGVAIRALTLGRNGVDAGWSVVEGDWDLYRPGPGSVAVYDPPPAIMAPGQNMRSNTTGLNERSRLG